MTRSWLTAPASCLTSVDGARKSPPAQLGASCAAECTPFAPLFAFSPGFHRCPCNMYSYIRYMCVDTYINPDPPLLPRVA